MSKPIHPDYQGRLRDFQNQKKSYQKLFRSLKKKSSKNLDELFHQAHEEAFEVTDCLSCGNCCKTTSPIFKGEDIERLSKRFRLNNADFIDKYLFEDEEGDFVLKGSPCPFLGEDNYCAVYEDRPKACRDYPHTHHRKMHQHLTLTWKNAGLCPAVVEVLNNIYHRVS